MLQDQQDRRMDALARLCKSTSTTCVAICYIKDEFYITANSLYSTKSHALRGRGEKKLKELVTTIWSYLSNIDLNSSLIPDDEHKRIFDKICSYERIQDERGSEGSKHTAAIHEAAVSWALANKEKLPAFPELKKKHGHNMGDVGYAYLLCMDLHTDLQKLEQSLFSTTSRSLDATDEDIKFSSAYFTRSPKIITEEDEAGVHAEVQMLSKIIQIIKENSDIISEKIYIGISRNCCLECHCMLEAAKEVLLQRSNIILDFRGSHDLPQNEKWNFPKFFSGSGDLISTQIKQLTEKKILEQKHQFSKTTDSIMPGKVLRNVSMGADGSDSEPEASALQQLTAFSGKLQELQENFTSFKDEISRAEAIKLIELGTELVNLESFKALFDYSSSASLRQAIITFEDIRSEYCKRYNSTLDLHKLFIFIKQPVFSRAITNYFIALDTPEMLLSGKQDLVNSSLYELGHLVNEASCADSLDQDENASTADSSRTTENTTPRSRRYDLPPPAEGESTPGGSDSEAKELLLYTSEEEPSNTTSSEGSSPKRRKLNG